MIDLALAKAHVRADGSAEDDLIQAYLDAAAAHVEGVTGKLLTRRLVTQPVSALSGFLRLWWGPDAAFTGGGAGIDYLDADGAPATVLLPRLTRDRVYAPLLGWPTTLDHSPIVVTYTAGFGTGGGETPVPPDLVQAQLMLVAHWWNNREAVSAAVVEIPLGVDAILRRHRPVLI